MIEQEKEDAAITQLCGCVTDFEKLGAAQQKIVREYARKRFRGLCADLRIATDAFILFPEEQ